MTDINTTAMRKPNGLGAGILIASLLALFGQFAVGQSASLESVAIVCPCTFESIDRENAAASIRVRNFSAEESPRYIVQVVREISDGRGLALVASPDPDFSGFTVAANSTGNYSIPLQWLNTDESVAADARFLILIGLDIGAGNITSFWRPLDGVGMQTPDASLFGATAWTIREYIADRDGDGIGDEDERVLRTDPDDENSAPHTATIDVVALHTPDFKNRYSSPEVRIQHWIEIANGIYEDSGAGIEFRLSSVAELDARSNDLGFQELLTELSDSDTQIGKQANDFRFSLGADVIVGFVESAETNCGIAFGAPIGYGYLAAPYVSIVGGDCSGATLAHELGHNFGLAHSFEQGTRGTFHWSRGHYVDERYSGEQISNGTMMTYGRTYRDIISDPNRNCGRMPCGVDRSLWAGADAVASLRATRWQVANFLVAPGTDSDGDGVPDDFDAFPNDPSEWFDSDGDGIGEKADTDDDIVNDDHGDSIIYSSVAGVPSDSAGVLSKEDSDFFRVTVVGSGKLTVYTSGSVDTYGDLYNSYGRNLGSNDDSGEGRNFHIERQVDGGVYHVGIRGFRPFITGSYTFHVRFASDDESVVEPVVEELFGAQQVITADVDRAQSVRAADLDGDGDLDVLSASAASGIAWYENKGGGMFSAARGIATEIFAEMAHAADLDGDGDMDVLSALFRDQVAWYENLGGGAFSTQRTITTDADGASDAYAADLDRDGDLDVLSASGFDDKIAWYENLGGGSFSAQRVITTETDWPVSVFAVDLDGDGDADVLSASRTDDKVAWYENLGGGTFSVPHIIATDGARDVYGADLDGDGDTDVLSTAEHNRIVWYENLGGGAFSTRREVAGYATQVGSVYAADLDNDGDIDLLSASFYDDKIAWYENQGGGEFSIQHVITTDAESATDVYAADLDGDGFTDVLSAAYNGDTIAWHKNLLIDPDNGPGNGPDSATTIGASSDTVGELTAGDYDHFRINVPGEGTLTVYSSGSTDTYGYLYDSGGRLASNDDGGEGLNFRIQQQVASGVHYVGVRGFSANTSGSYTLHVRFIESADNTIDSDGDGVPDIDDACLYNRYFSCIGIPVSDTGPGVSGIAAADFDGDGDADVLAGSFGNGWIGWFENLGGEFSDIRLITNDADGAVAVHAADLDGDGAPDALSASLNDNKIAWYQNLDGAGDFSAQTVISDESLEAVSVATADLDGDGDEDVLSASFGDNTIAWYENLGRAEFSEARIITTAAAGAFDVFPADLDSDGDVDVLTAALLGNSIAWHENLGDGTFSGRRLISTATIGAFSVFAADIDGDNDLDALSASSEDDKIAWYENEGAGEFSAQRIISADADFATGVSAADLDGDGDTDILSASLDDDKIAWHENLGNGTFADPKLINSGADGAFAVLAVDLDGDGDLDLLSSSFLDGKILWYENLLHPRP